MFKLVRMLDDIEVTGASFTSKGPGLSGIIKESHLEITVEDCGMGCPFFREVHLTVTPEKPTKVCQLLDGDYIPPIYAKSCPLKGESLVIKQREE